MRLTSAVALLVLAWFVSACGDDAAVDAGPGSPAPPDLEGRTFLSEEAQPPLVAGTVVRLTFEGEQVSVHAGCNTMGGGWTMDDGRLVVGQMFQTEMACEPDLMDQDARIAALLMGGVDLDLDGDVLVLRGTDDTLRMLDRVVADPDRALVGTVWTIDSLISDQAVSSMPGAATATLVLDADGRFFVDGPCNTTRGPVEVGDGRATFGPGASTRMMCDADAMDAEGHILAVLDGEVTVEIEGPVLWLVSVDGDLGLGLRAD